MSPQTASRLEAGPPWVWEDVLGSVVAEFQAECRILPGVEEVQLFLRPPGGPFLVEVIGRERVPMHDAGHPLIRALVDGSPVSGHWPETGRPGIACPLPRGSGPEGAVWFDLEQVEREGPERDPGLLESSVSRVGRRLSWALEARWSERRDAALAVSEKAARRLLSETSLHRALRLSATDLAELSGAREVSVWGFGGRGEPECLACARPDGPADPAWQKAVTSLVAELAESPCALHVADTAEAEDYRGCLVGGPARFLADPITASDHTHGMLLVLDYAPQPPLMGAGPEPGVAEAARLVALSAAAAFAQTEARKAADDAGQETRGLRGLLQRSERQAALFDLSRKAAEELESALRGIGDQLASLLDGSERADWRRDVLGLKERIGRAEDVLDELKNLTSLAPPRLRLTDLNNVIHDAVLEVRATPDRRADVSLRLQAGLPPLLLDAEKVKRMLVNLILHGISGVEPGEAVVTSRLQKSQVVVEIRVPGRFTPGGVLESIFVPFGSGDGTRRGVGLSLAHQIIKEHGGQLRAKSEPGEALLYWLSLPVDENQDRRRRRGDRRAARDRRQS